MIRLLWLALLVLTVAIFMQCAHPVNPSGGAKDVTPPVAIETSPQNGSAGFTTDRFTIKFDEYVSLEDVQQSALISPPMKDIPDYKVKGKSIQVKFNEELKPNTTYSVYFGDAIVDITEKNPLSNYTYIFSTGDYVDSLSLSGIVLNSFDLKPMEAVYVMLFKDNNDTIVFDSLPYSVVPYYLSKTNVDGRFEFNGLSDDNYLLFALSDKNSNYIFDQPGEEIAFLDSLVHPVYIYKPKLDSAIINDSTFDVQLTQDTLLVMKDSTTTDSIINSDIGSIEMFMFLSPDTIQRLLKAEVVVKNKIRFSFSQPATDVIFESLKFKSDSTWFVEEFSHEKDTLYWHLKEPPTDSLIVLLTHFDDTIGTVYLKLDPQKKSARLKKNEPKIEKVKLDWESNVKGGKLDLDKNLELIFTQPFVTYNNPDSALFVIDNDSIWKPEVIISDSLKMKLAFPFDLEEEMQYRVYFPDSSFTSWNNIHTNAIDITFRTPALSEYGTLTYKLHPTENHNFIIQLLNKEEVVIREESFQNASTITFSYLKPAEYITKVIYDINNNAKWDPGNYNTKTQPEKVIYYQKKVEVRANWDIEEDWKF